MMTATTDKRKRFDQVVVGPAVSPAIRASRPSSAVSISTGTLDPR